MQTKYSIITVFQIYYNLIKTKLLRLESLVISFDNENQDIDKMQIIIFWFITFLLIIIAGFRPIGIDKDSESYYTLINMITSGVDLSSRLEIGFIYIVKLFNLLFHNYLIRSLLLFFAFLGVFIKMYAIKNSSKSIALSLVVYVSLYFILLEMTQIRAGISVSFFLWSVVDIEKKRFVPFLIKAIIAISFHYTAIIILPLYILSNKKEHTMFWCMLPIIGILSRVLNIFDYIYILGIKFLPSIIAGRLNGYYSMLQNGTFKSSSMLHSFYLAVLLLYYILWVLKKRYPDRFSLITIKILGFSLFCYYSLSFMNVLAFRVSEFLNVILILIIPQLFVVFRFKKVAFTLICIPLLYRGYILFNNLLIFK